MPRGQLNYIEIFLPLLLSLVGALARVCFEDKNHTLWYFFRMIIIGVFVGMITSEIVLQSPTLSVFHGPIVAIAALLADDILSVLIAAGSQLRKDPIAAIKAFFFSARAERIFQVLFEKREDKARRKDKKPPDLPNQN